MGSLQAGHQEDEIVPVQAISKAFVQLLNGVVVEMIVVIVRDQNEVYVWKLVIFQRECWRRYSPAQSPFLKTSTFAMTLFHQNTCVYLAVRWPQDRLLSEIAQCSIF